MPARTDNLAAGIAANRLHLILLPTEACGFRCTYCYESFALGRMEPGVVDGIKRLLDSRVPTLDWLTMSWFGGEPLGAINIVIDLMEHVRDLRRERPGLHLGSDMTTNGWSLTESRFLRLHELGVDRYQVSFDGPPDLHDRKRVLRDGSGSFHRIRTNLRALHRRPEPFTVTIRVHVDRENASRLTEFFSILLRDFGGDPRFPLFLKPLARWGSPNDPGLDVLPGHLGEATVRRLGDIAVRMGLPLYHPGDEGVCYASRGNSLVVRADGRINKCTIALDSPRNQVGRIEPDGSLVLDHDRMLPWMRGLFSGDAGELQCPMIGLADGRFRTKEDVSLEPGRFVGPAGA